ncbi:uncharacterized protein DFL_003745 [Arthrobotrys flagrans]|uniref:Uncharacterized protein n=1 Tax=Arthrobotrys flagrans TaxID=97331 RepID=A0A437A2S0_ARTFL|nr:hypothetical protein DFL_003745 [Arthrobotrys flagrans]
MFSTKSFQYGTPGRGGLFGGPVFKNSLFGKGGAKNEEDSFRIHAHLTPGKTRKRVSLAKKANAGDSFLDIGPVAGSGVTTNKERAVEKPREASTVKKQQPELSTANDQKTDSEELLKTAMMAIKIGMWIMFLLFLVVFALAITLFLKW